MAICGMKSINLKCDALKILGVHFSYNKTLPNEMNVLKLTMDIRSALKLWRMQNLTLEERIIIFKTLPLTEIVYLAPLIIFLDYIIKEIKKIREHLMWKHSPSKIQYKTLGMDYQNGG